MPVDYKIRITTHQLAITGIAVSSMLMNIQTFHRAYWYFLLNVGYLSVTFLVMGMFWNLALLLHSDCRENQGIGRTKHHHCRKTSHNLLPSFPPMPLFRIISCLLQHIMLHSFITNLYSNFPKSDSGQTRKIIFPTTCSSATHPTDVLRESTDVAR